MMRNDSLLLVHSSRCIRASRCVCSLHVSFGHHGSPGIGRTVAVPSLELGGNPRPNVSGRKKLPIPIHLVPLFWVDGIVIWCDKKPI
jgi:hypothetical protein